MKNDLLFDSMFSSIPSINNQDYAKMFNYNKSDCYVVIELVRAEEKKKLDQEFDYMINILRNLPH